VGVDERIIALLSLNIYLALGYYTVMTTKKAASAAAKLMAQRSVEARREAWGEEEFRRRMKEYGKLGGRPQGGKDQGSGPRSRKS